MSLGTADVAAVKKEQSWRKGNSPRPNALPTFTCCCRQSVNEVVVEEVQIKLARRRLRRINVADRNLSRPGKQQQQQQHEQTQCQWWKPASSEAGEAGDSRISPGAQCARGRRLQAVASSEAGPAARQKHYSRSVSAASPDLTNTSCTDWVCVHAHTYASSGSVMDARSAPNGPRWLLGRCVAIAGQCCCQHTITTIMNSRVN